MATTGRRNTFAARWFSFGLYFFALALVGALAAIALGPLAQIRTLGALTMTCAAFGALVCLLGVRTYDPRRWASLRDQAFSVGDSLQGVREAIGEPRQLGYARVSDVPRRSHNAPRVVWPV